MRDAHVGRAVALANALQPDLIVLTGDFVWKSAGYAGLCAGELAALSAPHGVYAVLGNHDVWTDADRVAASLSAAGIAVLRDERRALPVGDASLWLLGLEDTGYLVRPFATFRRYWQSAVEALATLLADLPPAEPRLLLVHNPDFCEMLPPGRIDLALSGHTHGGQIRLPFVGSPILPSCLGQKYACGLVRAPTTWVYVNRGIGLIAPPVRLNCRPEVTLIRLRSGARPSPAPD